MRSWIDNFLLVLLSTAAIQNVFAIDLQPGDVIAPKPGFNSMQVSYQYSEKNDYYLHGEKVAAYPQISSSIYALRLGRSFEVAQLPAYFYAQLPFGAVHPQGGFSSDSGLGDASMALAVWPYANRETKTYFGVAGYLVAPTGSYDSKQVFNMGENRYKTALQVGYDVPVADKLAFMAAFDAVWFGDNNNASTPKQHQKLEQDELYTGQVGLRYDFNPQYSLTGLITIRSAAKLRMTALIATILRDCNVTKLAVLRIILLGVLLCTMVAISKLKMAITKINDSLCVIPCVFR